VLRCKLFSGQDRHQTSLGRVRALRCVGSQAITNCGTVARCSAGGSRVPRVLGGGCHDGVDGSLNIRRKESRVPQHLHLSTADQLTDSVPGASLTGHTPVAHRFANPSRHSCGHCSVIHPSICQHCATEGLACPPIYLSIHALFSIGPLCRALKANEGWVHSTDGPPRCAHCGLCLLHAACAGGSHSVRNRVLVRCAEEQC
jgi:hypothetical protein